MSREDLSLARIVAQGLAQPSGTTRQVVERLACLHSQELPGGLLSLTLRTTAGSLAEAPGQDRFRQRRPTWIPDRPATRSGAIPQAPVMAKVLLTLS